MLRYAQDKFDYLVKNPKAHTASLNREVKDVTDKLFRAMKDKDINVQDYNNLMKEFNRINSENKSILNINTVLLRATELID